MAERLQEKVTQILQGASAGDPCITEDLVPLLYEELRRLARRELAKERPGQTLQPTALVHEVYLRLVDGRNLHWESRGHFFAAAARAMRQILVDRARKRQAAKHGGQRARLYLDEVEIPFDAQPPSHILALHEALERLDRVDPRQAQVVMLRYFAGLTILETAKALGLSATTVTDEWSFAKAWLHREMTRDGSRG